MDRSKKKSPVSTAKKNAETARAPRKAYCPVPVNQLGVIDQIANAFRMENAFATAVGVIVGGFVPLAVYRTAHFGVQAHPALWILVLGGLIYSALTVFQWGVAAFSSPIKSIGFVLLLEGTLTFNEHALALGALSILAFINAVATACNLIAQKKEARKEAIAARKAK